MAEQIASTPPAQASPASDTPRGAPEFVSAEEYMDKYAHDFYEWVEGRLVKMAPISDVHDEITIYVRDMFRAYFSLNAIGKIRGAPFVQRLDSINSRREPDLMVILNDNPGQLSATAMIGPADICIEVVSLESVERDYGSKFTEYEKGGVKEYWLFDPIRKASHFHRLGEAGLYVPIMPDDEGNYETPLLPRLQLRTPTLWEQPLPDFYAIGEAVRKMLGK